MRFRVDTISGYASFDESEEDRARELYDEAGLRLRLCHDLHDEGVVIAGLPLGINERIRAAA
jgi:hypothetical protein